MELNVRKFRVMIKQPLQMKSALNRFDDMLLLSDFWRHLSDLTTDLKRQLNLVQYTNICVVTGIRACASDRSAPLGGSGRRVRRYGGDGRGNAR